VTPSSPFRGQCKFPGRARCPCFRIGRPSRARSPSATNAALIVHPCGKYCPNDHTCQPLLGHLRARPRQPVKYACAGAVRPDIRAAMCRRSDFRESWTALLSSDTIRGSPAVSRPAHASVTISLSAFTAPRPVAAGACLRTSGRTRRCRRATVFPVCGRVAAVSHIDRNCAFTSPLAATFTSTASHFVGESVRYTARSRGARDRPLRLAAKHRLAPGSWGGGLFWPTTQRKNGLASLCAAHLDWRPCRAHTLAAIEAMINAAVRALCGYSSGL
jgi:hypothetical protein